MPLQSREVITLRLILDCDCDVDLDSPSVPASPPTLETLPAELRMIVLRHLLRFDHTCKAHTRRVPESSIEHLLSIDSRRILEAPHFRHRSKQELNGVLPVSYTCSLYPTVLRLSRKLYEEGRKILYEENKVVGVQCGLRGLASRLRSYGLPAWGPLPSTTLAFEISGKTGKIIRDSSTDTTVKARFNPVFLLRGQNATNNTPLYICRARDGPDVLHALWILVMAPFARGMKFNAYLPTCPRLLLQRSTNSLFQLCALPWLHNHLENVIVEEDDNSCLEPRRRNFNTMLKTHKQSNLKEPCVYTYHAICAYLEIFMSTADRAVEAGQYLKAETLYERVLYEASSVVRTRTGKLVFVSEKTKDGINRICKLIAVSAFRLCELRSGSIVTFREYGQATSSPNSPLRSNSTSSPEVAFLDAPIPPEEQQAERHCTATQASTGLPSKPDGVATNTLSSAFGVTRSRARPHNNATGVQTTRLETSEALSHALLAGLLALRLPCATTVSEWNIRINLTLVYLFNSLGQARNRNQCLDKLHHNCSKLLDDAREKSRTGKKWEDLECLVADLNDMIERRDMSNGGTARRKKAMWEETQQLVEKTQNVVRQVWGERLTVKRNYVGLIWTFRWA